MATVSSAAAGARSDRPARAVRTRPPIEGNRTRLSHSVQRAACHPPRNVCDQPPPTAQRTPPRSVDISPAHRRTRSRRHCAAARAWSLAGCACRRSARRHRGAPPAVRGPAVRRRQCLAAPSAEGRRALQACAACAAGSADHALRRRTAAGALRPGADRVPSALGAAPCAVRRRQLFASRRSTVPTLRAAAVLRMG